MHKRYFTMCIGVLSIIYSVSVYCESCPSDVVVRRNVYKKAEAYKEANRLEQEQENSKKEDN